MSFSPVPRYSFRCVTDITSDFLKEIGVKLLMLDLDNTIAAYGQATLSDDMASWAQNMKSDGIELFIVSNSPRKDRVASFANALEIGSIGSAGKPSSRGLKSAMQTMRREAHESALAGDQIITDTCAANSAGAVSIIVRPLSCKNPILAFRYLLEKPFRAMCKNKG